MSEGRLDSPRERSSRRWVCGWASEGRACRLGPDHRGRCHATAECTPVRDDDGWRCTRPAASGGACDAGPLPGGGCSREIPKCQPRRSQLGRRTLVTTWVTVATLGAILMALGGSRRAALVSSGPLTSSHGASTDRCEHCHAVATEPGPALLTIALRMGDGTANDRLCLDCHDLGDHARRAHGVDPSDLTRDGGASLTVGLGDRLQTAIVAATAPADGMLACAACHVEHRGVRHALSDLDDRRCQACHRQRYAGFADHPEFARPATAIATIRFDHVSHAGTHHPAAAASFACQTCHALDETGRYVGLTGWQSACSGCHAAETEGSGQATRGIPFLSLPALDLESLASAGHHIGPWPTDADGDPTPFDVALLGPAPELVDLVDAGQNALDLAAEHARAIRLVIDELADEGHAALRRRLERAFGRTITTSETADLVAALDSATMTTARRRWLTRPEMTAPRDHEAADWVSTGGWYLDDDAYAISYRPRGHADPFVRAWIDAGVSGDVTTRRSPESSEGLRAIREALLDRSAPGRCGKCHRPGAASAWSATRRQGPRALTDFAHGPHVRLGADCADCHRLAAAASDRSFEPIVKADCADCHAPGRAGDGCLVCHAYHWRGAPE